LPPITPPFVQLASYGPLWAVLSVFMAIAVLAGVAIVMILKWVLEKQYASFRDDRTDLQAFVNKALEKLSAIHSECRDCHADNIARMKEITGQSDDKVINAVWNSNERVVSVLDKHNASNLVAVGREADRTIAAMREAFLQQANADLSREHLTTPPPVLPAGSQVRESLFRGK